MCMHVPHDSARKDFIIYVFSKKSQLVNGKTAHYFLIIKVIIQSRHNKQTVSKH